jgi:hypothetical protein
MPCPSKAGHSFFQHQPVVSVSSISIAMRILAYCIVVATLAGIAWFYPFLFELPLIAAIGGAYWTFFASKDDQPPV